MWSEALGLWRHYYVWLPPEYARSRRPFPVLYLLRGHHREWVKPFDVNSAYHLADGCPPLRTVHVAAVMDALTRSRKTRPAILVMPCMANADGTLTGLATDWIARHRVRGRQLRGVGTGRFGTHLKDELIDHVDRHFHTIAAPQGRAADGFSLGGYMALKLVLSRPEAFCAVGAYDGSFFYLHHRPGKMGEAPDYLVEHGLFDPVFDRPRRALHVQANSPAALLQKAPDWLLQRLTFHLQCGPQQAEPMDSNFYRTMHMIRLLQMRGIRNQADPVVLEDGHHDWPTAYRHLAQALACFSGVWGSI